MRLGIIARSDNTGLGNQTKELVDMLNPDKVMLINSQSFNKNKQHPDWYEKYNCVYVRGFPGTSDINAFLKNIDVVLSCETFYNNSFVLLAKNKGVKTFLQYNYEFLDYLQKPDQQLPDTLIAPSLWGFETVSETFGTRSRVVHLPPPTSPETFSFAKSTNINKQHKRLLHVAGKSAHLDRNGTKTIIEMLKYSKSDYEMVIKSQSALDFNIKDSRLTIDTNSPENRQDLYTGFDAMILPRRYAGLCLPMNEALMSALPVFMTNISPNNIVLPSKWLVPSKKINEFKARTMIDVYEADPEILANLIDDYVNNSNMMEEKQHAFEIGINNFSVENLKQKYLDILEQ
jgi:glycosyltransferase involved in cell wall biosynthesis